VSGHAALAGRIGWTPEDIEALGNPVAWDRFGPALAAALDYAGRMTRDAHSVTDEVFASLKAHYPDTQIIEISCVVSMANYFNRFTGALRIDLSGTDEPYDPEWESRSR